MKKSNRHVSHLGGMGSGDGLSTSLNQDMSPPKISGGGFEGTADANFSKKIGQLRVHIDDDDSLMFPENEEIETIRKKDTIRSKIPFDGRYKMRESKNSKKTLIDLFDDKYFEEDETATHFKEWDPERNNQDDLGKDYDEFKEWKKDKTIEKDYNYNKSFSPATQKAQQLSIKKLNEAVKKQTFQMIKKDIESNGFRLVLKENAMCKECGMMYEGCKCNESAKIVEKDALCEKCGIMNEECICEYIDEANFLGSGNVAGYQTKLSTPKNMKKHKQKMLPTGYKYR